MQQPGVALTIAGSDCSAGAGIQADLRTFETHQVFGLTAITGIVAESPLEVKSWEAASPTLLEDQLSCILESYPIRAIKTGLLFNSELVEVIANTLSIHSSIPLIIDPVGTASTGTKFANSSFLQSLEKLLFPLATLITPNLKEAQLLSNHQTSDLTVLATELAQTHQTNVLVKGGHSEGNFNACDILGTVNGKTEVFTLPRISGPDYHGTGCTLSAAITARLVMGDSLSDAIREAKQFLHDAILKGHAWGDIHALNTFRNS